MAKSAPVSASPTRTVRSRLGSGATSIGSMSSLSITTLSHSRSSHSQTAVGWMSTPKMDVVSTSRRTSATGRWSPQARRSAAIRSRAYTRKAPDPHAGSTTRNSAVRAASRACQARGTAARSTAPRTRSGSSPVPASAVAIACAVAEATIGAGVKYVPVDRRSRDIISDSNARPSISGSIAASLHVAVSSRAVKRWRASNSPNTRPSGSSRKRDRCHRRSTGAGAKSPPFRNGILPNARAAAARCARGVFSVPKNSGCSSRWCT